MEPIIDHKTNAANEVLEITRDAPGAGGASHEYVTHIPGVKSQAIHFQNGPIAEVGHNGTTNEALIAIVLDRLRGFQSGAYSCRENALAITKLEEALHWMHHRTNQRVKRGVEGTSAV